MGGIRYRAYLCTLKQAVGLGAMITLKLQRKVLGTVGTRVHLQVATSYLLSARWAWKH